MDSEQLRYFKAVVDYGNMTRASQALYISQPTLSYYIKKIEDELGVRLFDRAGKKIVLNQNGRRLLKYSEMSERLFADLNREFSEPQSGEDIIRIKTYATISELMMEYSKIDATTSFLITNIRDYEAIQDLLGYNDAIVLDSESAEHFNLEGLDRQFLFTDELLYSVPFGHPLSSREVVTIDEAAGHGMAIVRGKNGEGNINRWVRKIEREEGVRFDIEYETTQAYWQTLYSVPYGFFCRSTVCLYDDTVTKGRHFIPIGSPLARRDAHIYYSKDRLPKIASFLETMTAVSEQFVRRREAFLSEKGGAAR